MLFLLKSVVKLALIAFSLEENIGIIIASLPVCRRLFKYGLGGKSIRSYLSRFALSTKQNSHAKSRTSTSIGRENFADHLVPLTDIRVRKSLEVQLSARTPSDCELGQGSDALDDLKWLNVPRAVEKV